MLSSGDHPVADDLLQDFADRAARDELADQAMADGLGPATGHPERAAAQQAKGPTPPPFASAPAASLRAEADRALHDLAEHIRDCLDLIDPRYQVRATFLANDIDPERTAT
jgi:hypothetical protein